MPQRSLVKLFRMTNPLLQMPNGIVKEKGKTSEQEELQVCLNWLHLWASLRNDRYALVMYEFSYQLAWHVV